MARLYYISLARSHYPSALIVLAGIVALGTAQDHGSLPLQPATIPTASAALIMVGLGLLYVLGRIAVDVTVEPLLETISQLRIPERSEIGLLRRAVELLEMPRNTPRNDSQPAVPVGELPERLIETIEQGQRGLADAISRLSANAETLEAAIRALVEPLATAIHAAAAPKLPADHDKTAGAAFPELQAAVEELTAVLRRLSAPPARAAEPDGASDPAPPSTRPSTPGLARELRRLLQEIEAVR